MKTELFHYSVTLALEEYHGNILGILRICLYNSHMGIVMQNEWILTMFNRLLNIIKDIRLTRDVF